MQIQFQKIIYNFSMESKKGNSSASESATVPPINDYEIPIAEVFLLNAKKKLGSGAFGEIYYGINRKTKQT